MMRAGRRVAKAIRQKFATLWRNILRQGRMRQTYPVLNKCAKRFASAKISSASVSVVTNA
jgi:hypothetical protein